MSSLLENKEMSLKMADSACSRSFGKILMAIDKEDTSAHYSRLKPACLLDGE